MKRCFKCGRTKPVSEFYRHARMADGYLGKCKDCARRDVRANRATRAFHYRMYEAARYPMRKQRFVEWLRQERLKHPERRAARVAVGNAVRDGRLQKQPCVTCGARRVHAHHPDYSKPLAVTWLCSSHHAAVHQRRS